MARVVIVSNRVPLPTDRGPRAGGLAIALKDVIKSGGLWFGWSGRIAEASGMTTRMVTSRGTVYATIDLSERDYQHYYVGFANSSLWPLLHSRLGLMEFDREYYEGYCAVNRAFATALAPLLKPDDLIWAHDYHLFPLATELRKLGVRNRLGFFLHVPFVPARVFTVLPRAKELIRMICDYDIVGFQTRVHLHDFFDCVHELLKIREDASGRFLISGHSTYAFTDPIGIDARGFAEMAKLAAEGPEAQRLRESLVGRALVIGVDRLDYSKGLENRFEAFARLLSRYPEHRLKVSYFQVAASSREDVKQYRSLRRELDRICGDINGRFAEFDWVPLRYMTRAVPRGTLAGFYRIAQIGLVTPLQDGMNLVAKEYVAAQDPANPGVLILSRFAGAAEELTDALIVNPYDADEIAEALHAALSMPIKERCARYEQLSASVFTTTAETYCRAFLNALADGVGTPDVSRIHA